MKEKHAEEAKSNVLIRKSNNKIKQHILRIYNLISTHIQVGEIKKKKKRLETEIIGKRHRLKKKRGKGEKEHRNKGLRRKSHAEEECRG